MRELARDIGMLFLRVSFGLTMIIGHGWPKIGRAMADGPIQFADPIGLGPAASLYSAIFTEVVCAFLIVIGLQTRIASLLLAFTMIVAAFIVHSADPFFTTKEFPLLYAFACLALVGTGAGRFSVDHAFRK